MAQDDVAARLKAAIYLNVAKIVEQHTKNLETHASPGFIASLVELVYNQLQTVGEDLELFADHAGRHVVDDLDLYMVTRKNEALTAALKEFERDLK